MNRNTELHFSQVPKINQKRSKFEMSHSVKTTFNTGDIVPIYVDADILPGDTVQMDMAELIRMATPIYPIMDNLYADIYWFFVPHRLVWEHWQAFWGENDDPWTQTTEYEVPQIEAPEGGWTEGTIADYMGIPTKVDGISVNAMPIRAYAKIINDWFRDENVSYNCHIYTDETTRTGLNGTETDYSYITGTELGGKPVKASKFHDYFTSALPEPQKGEPVTINIAGGLYPVKTTNENVYDIGDTAYNLKYIGVDSNNKIEAIKKENYGDNYRYTQVGQINDNEINPQYHWNVQQNGWTEAGQNITPNNLYTDLSNATVMTINQLRTAFAIQKYYEAAGRFGTRYIEFLRGIFGVTSSDARLQRAEYIGGQRVPLNIDQIIQTSSTDATTPQGNTAGFSCTLNNDSMFTKSFEEHGTLMCCMVIRTDHTYQQGLNRMWTRKKWTDYYNPFFANLGETAILNKEIYAQGTSVVDSDGNIIDEQAFGYQEAWAEYRYKNNTCTGYMRSNATGSLDVWHFADDYSSLPYLSDTWVKETQENVDRTIAVTSQLTHQFIADIFFKTYYTRPMPIYSIPGLIDHV